MDVLTFAFIDAVGKRWGDPEKVAEAALEEIERQGGTPLEVDAQIKNALRVGIMAGSTRRDTPTDFLNVFAGAFDLPKQTVKIPT
jgi:hypothetical protein